MAVRGSRHDDKFRVSRVSTQSAHRPCVQLGVEHQYALQASAACCKRRKSLNATTAPTTLRLHSRSVADPKPLRSAGPPQPARLTRTSTQDDIFSWHFTVRGPKSSDFEGQSRQPELLPRLLSATNRERGVGAWAVEKGPDRASFYP